jgi:hypothetical protein
VLPGRMHRRARRPHPLDVTLPILLVSSACATLSVCFINRANPLDVTQFSRLALCVYVCVFS